MAIAIRAPGGQPARLLVRLGADRPHADGQVGRRAAAGIHELTAVARRDLRAGGVDEVGEGVRQPELGRPDAALRRGAQQPGLGRVGEPGQGGEAPEGMVVGQAILEQPEQLGQLRGEVVGSGLAAVALQREGRHRIGAGRAPDGEVDAIGEEAGEDAEALGHLQRAVVGEHHAAAAHADARRGHRDRADQDLGARPGEHRAAVVLGEPVAVVAEVVGEAREVEGVAERVGAGRALRNGRLVEDAEHKRISHSASRR
jgi:hypothetical protein